MKPTSTWASSVISCVFNSLDHTMNDLELGNKVISYALNSLAWGVSCAVAWSCSTLLMGIVMFIIMAIVMALLCAAMRFMFRFTVSTDTRESIGRTAARVTSLFTRKASAAV